MKSQKLTAAQRDALFSTLEARFAKHPKRHESINWLDVEEGLKKNAKAIASLAAMEASGGEPDVIGHDEKTGEFLFVDCAAESPKERRSLCFDRKALDSRKANKPRGSALEMAAEIGIQILTEAQYRQLQTLGEFDLKTSSWIATPPEIRKLGGALFCDRRFDTVFVYHNGAESYYAARGFRGMLRV